MKTITENRKSKFNYTYIDTYLSAVCLNGCEIKSIRNGNVNISDGFCYITEDGEIWMKNVYIKPYEFRGYMNIDPNRDRKLLLRKHEIRKLSSKIKQKGFTIIPTKIIINDKGLCKIEIALCKGKSNFDKRESIKEKDIKREMEREIK